MSKKFTRIALFLAYILLAGCMGSWVAQTSNVPSSRLGSSYASPGAEYTVKVPFLLKPGARIPGHAADLDGDGVVGILDFLSLLGAWGPCP